MVINHRFSNIFCALTVLIFSASAYAAEYSSLSQCRAAYYGTNPDGSIPEADAFCKPKMDPIVFCTQQAVSLEQQLAAAPYSTAQLEAANAKYKNLCIASGGASVAVNVASTGAAPPPPASPYALPANTFGIPLPPDPSAAIAACGANQSCVQMRQAEFAALSNTYMQRVSAATATAQQQQQAQQQAQEQQQQQQQAQQDNAMGNMLQALPMMMGQGQQPQAAAANTGDTGFGGNGSSGASNEGTSSGTRSISNEPPALTPAQEQQQANIGKEAGPAVDGAANELSNQSPEVRDAAKGVVDAKNTGANVPPDAATVAESEQASTQFQREVEQTLRPIFSKFQSAKLMQTANEFSMTKAKPLIEKYEKMKETCGIQSGKTETLCVEGSSPGAQAARTLMDVAGPMMLIMNSAQKACSSTSKVTNLAGLGLTAANGVCIASKMKCEGLCKEAIKELETARDKITKDAETALSGEYQAAITACGTDVSCTTKVNQAKASFPSDKSKVDQAFNKQKQPDPGTPAAMQAKCEKKMRNILGMMANIAAIMAAKKGADDCEKKLASTGQAGNALSTQQFCESPANSGSQFCRCQNGSAEGCPNAQLIAAPGTEGGSGKNPNDAAGASIRPTSGLSNFAGGGMNPKGSNGDIKLGGAGGSDGGDTNPFGPLSSGAAALNAANGGGGAPGSGSAAAAAADAAAAKKGKAEDDNKWSFGAMAAGVGSMFGGGKGGAGNGDLKNVNPGLKENVQRKIASDRMGMQVTPASGTSNWEKVHKTMVNKVESTLIRGN